VTVLDIGQAVVHENLVLGMLIEAHAGSGSHRSRRAHRPRHELGLRAHFKVIAKDAVKHWVHGLRHHHFIITVLGRSITAEHLARVSAIISATE